MWFNFLGKPRPALYEPISEGTSTKTHHSVRYAKFYHLSSSILLFVCLLQSTAIIYLLRFALGSGKLLPAATAVPPIPWQTVEFTRDGLMHDLRHSEDVENAWRNYETTAFVHIPNPRAYSLRPNKGVIAGTENIYMISAHHQLHCLKKLQLGHVAAATGDADHMMAKGHAEHCFDYLRQAILCAADSALEGVDPGRPGHLQGYGAKHQCRAWNGPEGLDTWRQMHCAGEGLGCHN